MLNITQIQKELDTIYAGYLPEFQKYIPENQAIFEAIVNTGIFETYDVNVILGSLQNISDAIKTIERKSRHEVDNSLEKTRQTAD